jgi:CspA family cold shock protein
MATGTVKWFNNQKGYGFICAIDSQEEIFAHFSSIVMEGYKSLKAGQPVDFEVNPGPKGLHALNIRPAGMPIPDDIEQTGNSSAS